MFACGPRLHLARSDLLLLCCAWMKLKHFEHALTDKHVSIALRFKLFESVITSISVYSLETSPLTEGLQNRLDVVQRRMLRRMIGWVSSTGDTWEQRGSKMKLRLQRCLAIYPLMDWSTIIQQRKNKLVSCKSEWPEWTKLATEWSPIDAQTLIVLRRVDLEVILLQDGMILLNDSMCPF